LDEFLNSNKKKKKQNEEEVRANCEDMINNLLSKMIWAFEQDNLANKERQPALHKLMLVPEIEETLSKSVLYKMLVEKEIYGIINDWLSPLPDGSHPNLKIKEVLLKALFKLPTDKYRIRACGIGKIIMAMKNNPKETPNIKKLAYDVIDKWTRPQVNLSKHYEDMEIDLKAHQQQNKDIDPENPDSILSRKKDDYLPAHVKHASGCAKVNLDYVIRPVGIVSSAINSPTRTINKIDKHIEKLKRPTIKGSSRANKISVEGRGI